MTFCIAPHILSLLNSPALCQFPLLCRVHTSQAFAGWKGLAHRLVISSPSCSWFLRLLPALKTWVALLCTPPTQHRCEGLGNRCDNPHTPSLQLVGEGHLLLSGDHNIETGQNHPGFCRITFQGRTICCLSGSLYTREIGRV